MEKCKFCQKELAENGTFCPHCGKDNAAPVAEEVAAEAAAPADEQIPVAGEEMTAQETAPAEETVAGEEEVPAQEKSRMSPGKVALVVAAVLVLVAALIALVVSGISDSQSTSEQPTEAAVVGTIPADGNPDDVTCKGSYTVTDEEAKAAADTVVATMGEDTLTNGQLQVYYWSVVNNFLSSEYGYYMMAYGLLDYTQPLDTQTALVTTDTNQNHTWQQFFLQEALEYWQMNQSLTNEAKAANLEMSQEDREFLDTLEEELTETAVNVGLSSAVELLQANVGPAARMEDFAKFQELYYTGKPYYTAKIESLVPSDEDLESYFAEHEEDYADSGITKDTKYVDVRHILVSVEGGTAEEDGTVTYPDGAWETCQAQAQEILDAWLAGEQTEDSFAALAQEKSQDPGSSANGGLYENVYEGQMVEPFETWCFDESRASGDYGLVKTSYGYHVMYYVTSRAAWRSYAESDWVSYQTNKFIEDLALANPMKVDYSAIALGYLSLG